MRTPNWLFKHTITIYHYDDMAAGVLATPITASESVTGHFQLQSRVVRMPDGTELASEGYIWLPYGTTLNPLDEVECSAFSSRTYRLANITKPNLGGGTSAFVRADLI